MKYKRDILAINVNLRSRVHCMLPAKCNEHFLVSFPFLCSICICLLRQLFGYFNFSSEKQEYGIIRVRLSVPPNGQIEPDFWGRCGPISGFDAWCQARRFQLLVQIKWSVVLYTENLMYISILHEYRFVNLKVILAINLVWHFGDEAKFSESVPFWTLARVKFRVQVVNVLTCFRKMFEFFLVHSEVYIFSMVIGFSARR